MNIQFLHASFRDKATGKIAPWLDSGILSNLSPFKEAHGVCAGRVHRVIHERLKPINAVKRCGVNQWNAEETDMYP